MRPKQLWTPCSEVPAQKCDRKKSEVGWRQISDHSLLTHSDGCSARDGVSMEEISMHKSVADEANKLGQQAQEQLQNGLEAASRSFVEANKGFQSLATEITEYSKAAFDGPWRREAAVGHCL